MSGMKKRLVSFTRGINISKQPEIRVLPMPSDTNAAGDIFGG